MKIQYASDLHLEFSENWRILRQEGPIDVSNVMLLHKGQPTRVGFKFVDGKKVRFAKKTGEVID